MNTRQLLCARLSISVGVLSTIFIIAIIFGPKLLQTPTDSDYDYYDYNSEAANRSKLETTLGTALETRNRSGNYTSVICSDDFEGYCLNGGLCIYLEEENTAACICTGGYGGKRCQKYLWYH